MGTNIIYIYLSISVSVIDNILGFIVSNHLSVVCVGGGVEGVGGGAGGGGGGGGEEGNFLYMA